MLNQLQKRKEKGFTIIEVLIVLAIAGLILLVVFLAVPALQRNSRNTQAKSTAAAILGAVSEYVNNNSGGMPNDATVSGTTVTISGSGSSATANVQGGYTVDADNSFPTGTGTFNVAFNYKCSGNTAVTASARSTAILFRIEGGSGTVQQCVES
jgi:type IV pilus assembly protein PilA